MKTQTNHKTKTGSGCWLQRIVRLLVGYKHSATNSQNVPCHSEDENQDLTALRMRPSLPFLTSLGRHGLAPQSSSPLDPSPNFCIEPEWSFADASKSPTLSAGFECFRLVVKPTEIIRAWRTLLCRVLMVCSYKNKRKQPNIPSSATPQAGLEPRKRNGGEQ